MNRPELSNATEAVQVLIYSLQAILYYGWLGAKRHFHRFVHLLWVVLLAIVWKITGIDLIMIIGVGGALLYASLWMVGLGDIFERRNNKAS